ncbi:MAG: peptidoglycan DD-metalloendopeptidase family protein, partial [Fidelibacterota bacterium]
MKWPFRKSVTTRGVRFVVLKDGDSGVRQWSLSQNSFVAVSVLVIVLSSALLFFSADLLTGFLYKSRLQEIRDDNQSLISLLLELQDRLNGLESQVGEIEQKDHALRTYANLPPIDTDIRKLGVGGISKNRASKLQELLPDIEVKISELEVDLGELSRRISLEKESFETIYNAVRKNADKLISIPSLRPVEGGYVNTGFGYRRDPFTNERRFHYGQDISAPRGTPVYAATDGKVVYASYKGSYGKSVKIDHGHGYQTIYAHLNRMAVRFGQTVRRGQIIGEVGSTGRSTAPHLHYEVRYYG